MRGMGCWKWAVLASVLTLSAGCSDDDDTGEGTESGNRVEDLVLNDAQIARVLQVANEGEIQLSQVGLSRATATAARNFATRMVTEHTAARQRLDSLLQAQGLQPADSIVAQQLQEEVQRLVLALEAAQGTAVDLALMDAQLAAHARTAMLGDALLTPQVQNEALAQELRTQRLDVQEHLRDALPIQSDLLDAQ